MPESSAQRHLANVSRSKNAPRINIAADGRGRRALEAVIFSPRRVRRGGGEEDAEKRRAALAAAGDRNGALGGDERRRGGRRR